MRQKYDNRSFPCNSRRSDKSRWRGYFMLFFFSFKFSLHESTWTTTPQETSASNNNPRQTDLKSKPDSYHCIPDGATPCENNECCCSSLYLADLSWKGRVHAITQRLCVRGCAERKEKNTPLPSHKGTLSLNQAATPIFFFFFRNNGKLKNQVGPRSLLQE